MFVSVEKARLPQSAIVAPDVSHGGLLCPQTNLLRKANI